MRELKSFLQNTTATVLLGVGFSIALGSFAVSAVVVDTGNGSAQQQELPKPKDYAREAGGESQSQESYDTIPPLQDASQLFPSYPGVAGPQLPTPPTYLDPNMGRQSLPMVPTGQPLGGGQAQSGGMMGSPMTGMGPTGEFLGGPMGAAPPMGGTSPSGEMGSNLMMPASPTPGQNLNQLGIADPQYGRFESARLEASLTPRQPAQMNAARNQVIRGGKAFSGYRQPSPYSPYMSLMRTQDSIRGIDNYYEFVMPRIQQQQTNKQVSQEIGGLQSTARSGYEALQQIKQRPGNAPVQSGSTVPATFMNTGNYFGGGK